MAIAYLEAPFRVLDAVSPKASARLALRFFTTPRRWPAPAWEQGIAAGAEPISLANGHAGLSWGHGPPVLLVHGWEGRATQLGRFVAPLTARGYRVIGFDAPAHGVHRGPALDVLAYAQFLRGVAAEYGPLRGVIAHSMGAASLAFAARLPLRVGRAVLISTPRSVEGVLSRFEVLLGLGARTREILRARLEAELFRAPLAELDLVRHVPRYLPPTLLVAADDDADVPAGETQQLAARWPRAHMKIALAVGGHRKVLRDRLVIEAVIDFIDAEAWLPRPLAAAPDARSAPARAAHAGSA